MVHWITSNLSDSRVAVRIIADDQIGSSLELAAQFRGRSGRKILEIRPYLETGNPVRHDVVVLVAEGDAQNPSIAGLKDLFFVLPAGGVTRIGNQARQNDDLGLNRQSGEPDFFPQVFFKRPDLIENVDHLPTGVRLAEHIGLPKPTMGRNDGDLGNQRHGNPRNEPFH
jgi:hypothetical protein